MRTKSLRLWTLSCFVSLLLNGALAAADDDGEQTFRFLTGTGLTEGVPQSVVDLVPATQDQRGLCNWASQLGPQCPTAAESASGDLIEFQGEGRFDVHGDDEPGRASGAGSLAEISAGEVLRTGVWKARRLISFINWGKASDVTNPDGSVFPGGDLPRRWTAGRALIKVDIWFDDGEEGRGVLDVVCRLPGDNAPASSPGEGSFFEVIGGQNYDTSVIPRATLFIEVAQKDDDDDDDDD